MKPTCTRADTEMFDSLNPTFHSFLKSYATDDFIRSTAKTKYLNIKNIKDVIKTQETDKEKDKDDETKENNEESDQDFSEQLYYDIQFLDENFTGKL